MPTCPRRMTELGPWERAEDLDSYERGRGLSGVQGDSNSCSFCGSLHPDTFMEWLEAGAEITPTDKSYKAYLKCPYPNERYGETKVEQTDSGGSITSVYGQEAKFYYQHLSAEQRQRFIELYNEKKLTIGYPGDFYRLPFFCSRGPSETGEA